MHDFLAFEDSDDSGDFKVVMSKKNRERYNEEATKTEVKAELDVEIVVEMPKDANTEEKSLIELSP